MKITLSNNVKVFLALLILSLIGLAISNYGPINERLKAKTSLAAEQQFGPKLVAPAQEEMIRNIAREMGVTEPFTIRKMNQQALASFGYANAITYFPSFMNFFPIGSTPFLFISEGLLEDLSPAEQRFLIGHELVHVQERHTEYLNLLHFAFAMILILLWNFSRKHIAKITAQYTGSYHAIVSGVISGLLLLIYLTIPNITALAYRRHIEWEADRTSLLVLKSYDGCIQFMNRIECEFLMPAHNPYFGLISDHPSCFERKNYCESLKNNAKESL